MVWSSLRALPCCTSRGDWVARVTKPLNFRIVRNISSTTRRNAGWARKDQASSMMTALRSWMTEGSWMRRQTVPMRAITNGTATSGSLSSPVSSK